MLVEFYCHLSRLYPCLGNSTVSGSCGYCPGVLSYLYLRQSYFASSSERKVSCLVSTELALCCCSNQLCLIFTPKCFSDLPKDLYCWSQDMNNQILVCSILISAGVGALSSIFKVLAEFLQTQCWACSQLISVLSGPSDDIIQVDELDANCIHMVLELCLRDMQIHHTLFLGYILC